MARRRARCRIVGDEAPARDSQVGVAAGGATRQYPVVTSRSAIVLDLLGAGSRLRVSVECAERGVDGSSAYEVRCEATAPPFTGTVTDLLLPDDLRFFATNLRRLAAPGSVILGGERAAELRLEVEKQVGGQAGRLVVEVHLTPSGDDPWPSLRWLIFDQEPFWSDAAAALESLVAEDER